MYVVMLQVELWKLLNLENIGKKFGWQKDYPATVQKQLQTS